MYTDIGGERIFYSNGNGSFDAAKRTVVFIHGAGMDHSVWVLPARYFARHRYNVFAFDLPGHGRSQGNPLTSIDAMVDWLESAFESLSIRESALVGHSMGSLVALSFAARHPQRTGALALLGTAIPMQVGELLLDAARDNHHDAIDMVNTWSHSVFGQLGGNANPGMSMTMCGQRLLEKSAADVLFTDLAACNRFSQGQELARLVRVPTMVILGEQDKMTSPAVARSVADLIDDCETVSLQACGHSMLSEQPNAVLDALARHI